MVCKTCANEALLAHWRQDFNRSKNLGPTKLSTVLLEEIGNAER
jgi:hypothetical protein